MCDKSASNHCRGVLQSPVSVYCGLAWGRMCGFIFSCLPLRTQGHPAMSELQGAGEIGTTAL